MPITILDLVLLGVMLISGLLALVRGFMREILSIAAWGAAALVTLYAFAKLLFQVRHDPPLPLSGRPIHAASDGAPQPWLDTILPDLSGNRWRC